MAQNKKLRWCQQLAQKLSGDDIDRVFLPENNFSSAVILPIPAKAADMTTNDVQEPVSPRIISIPYMGGDIGYYNITPHMNNCK